MHLHQLTVSSNPMRPRTICTVFFLAAALAPAQVRANDTTAELATGGLIFTKSPDIEMRSEDLFISMKEIRVQYKFFNHSNNEVVTQVAFPVPDLSFGTELQAVDYARFAAPIRREYRKGNADFRVINFNLIDDGTDIGAPEGRISAEYVCPDARADLIGNNFLALVL